MKRVLKMAGVSVLFAVAVILISVQAANSATFSTTYYDIIYFNSTQLRFARGLAPFLNRAFWAAKTTIGYDARVGKMRIYFTRVNNGALGWTYAGFQRIYLNTFYLKSFNTLGSVVAHESAHVLFFNFTQAQKWNRGLLDYTTFLTESLSWYAGDYVYNHFRYTPSSAFSQIRAHLKYFAARTEKTLSWKDAGFNYRTGTTDTNLFNQTIWQLRAIGWYLTGGRLTSSSPNVQKLLNAMRSWTSVPGSRLRSTNSNTALAYFEYAFQYAYGRRANAGWTLTGSTNDAFKSTRYLYGSFWYLFYN